MCFAGCGSCGRPHPERQKIVLLLFHRNLYRILTYFGDNQRFVYGIRGCTIRCNRRAEILAISSIELHHFAIIKSRESNNTIMGRSHNATCFYHIDVSTSIQVSINPIQRSLRLIRCFISICCSINRNIIGSRKSNLAFLAISIRSHISIRYRIMILSSSCFASELQLSRFVRNGWSGTLSNRFCIIT